MGCGASLPVFEPLAKTSRAAARGPDYCFDVVCQDAAASSSSSGRLSRNTACWIPEHKQNRAFRELPESLRHIELSLDAAVLAKPMRLLHLSAVAGSWQATVPVYEAVPASEREELSYREVTQETWDVTAVLSWRWSNPKPKTRDDNVMPLSTDQLEWLKAMATRLLSQGLRYIWIDWCCVPQYSEDASETMMEIMRSRLYYARARVMVVLPDVRELQLSPIRLLLLMSVLEKLEDKQKASGQNNHSFSINGGSAPWLLTRQLLHSIIDTKRIARCDYFGRVWTLAERMARCGRGEGLFDWLPLPLWLGMVLDVLLTAAQQAEAAAESGAGASVSEKFFLQLFSAAMQERLRALLAKLRTASSRGNLAACPGVSEDLALFLADAVEAWCVHRSAEEPSVGWLKEYLPAHPHDGGPEALKMYQAWDPADAVWAVYGFFCFHIRPSSPEGTAAACDDLWRHAFDGKTQSELQAAEAAGKQAEEEELRRKAEKARQLQLKKEAGGILGGWSRGNAAVSWLVKNKVPAEVARMLCVEQCITQPKELQSLEAADIDKVVGMTPAIAARVQNAASCVPDEKTETDLERRNRLLALLAVPSLEQLLDSRGLGRLWQQVQANPSLTKAVTCADHLKQKLGDAEAKLSNGSLHLTRFERGRLAQLVADLDAAKAQREHEIQLLADMKLDLATLVAGLATGYFTEVDFEGATVCCGNHEQANKPPAGGGGGGGGGGGSKQLVFEFTVPNITLRNGTLRLDDEQRIELSAAGLVFEGMTLAGGNQGALTVPEPQADLPAMVTVCPGIAVTFNNCTFRCSEGGARLSAALRVAPGPNTLATLTNSSIDSHSSGAVVAGPGAKLVVGPAKTWFGMAKGKDRPVLRAGLAIVKAESGGVAELANCAVTGSSADALVACGRDAKLVLKECEVYGSKGAGVAVSAGGSAALDGCNVIGSIDGSGVSASGPNSVITLVKCSIRENNKANVSVSASASVTLNKACELTKSVTGPGLLVTGRGSSADVKGKCVLGYNMGPGALVCDGGHAVLHDVSVLGSKDGSGVKVEGAGSRADLSKFKLSANARYGFEVLSSGQVDLHHSLEMNANRDGPAFVEEGAMLVERHVVERHEKVYFVDERDVNGGGTYQRV